MCASAGSRSNRNACVRRRPWSVPGLSFHNGGFELPVPGKPVLVRAFNVLRQYEEADVRGIWQLVQGRLAPDGLFIDGTCDEIGRRVRLDCAGCRAPAEPEHVGALRQFRAAVRDRRTPAQSAHPPECSRRTRPRAAAGHGPGVAGVGAAGILWKPATVDGHVPGAARRRVAGAGRPLALAAGGTYRRLGSCGAGLSGLSRGPEQLRQGAGGDTRGRRGPCCGCRRGRRPSPPGGRPPGRRRPPPRLPGRTGRAGPIRPPPPPPSTDSAPTARLPPVTASQNVLVRLPTASKALALWRTQSKKAHTSRASATSPRM